MSPNQNAILDQDKKHFLLFYFYFFAFFFKSNANYEEFYLILSHSIETIEMLWIFIDIYARHGLSLLSNAITFSFIEIL